MSKETVKKSEIISTMLGIGIMIVIAIAIGIGFLWKGKSPKEVWNSSIKTLSTKTINSLENLSNINDFKENDFSLDGSLSFDTSQENPILEELKKLNLDIHLGISPSKEIVNLNLGIKDNEKSILQTNLLFQDGKSYFDMPEILSTPVDLKEASFDFSQIDLSGFSVTKKDYEVVINEITNILTNSIDETKLEKKNNVKKTFHDTTIVVTEYLYKMDAEMTKNFIKTTKEKILKNEDLLNALAKITNKSKDEITEYLKTINEEKYSKDLTLTLDTTGIKNTPVSFEVAIGDKMFSYLNLHTYSALFLPNMVMEINEEQNETSIKAEYDESKIELTIKKSEKNNQIYDFTMKIESHNQEETITVSLKGMINGQSTVEKQNMAKAKKEEEYTSEEKQEFYTKLNEKIKGTSLEEIWNIIFAKLV